MNVNTSLIGREIVASALDLHKNLAQARGALDRRLGFSEKEAREAIATNTYVRGAFEKISPEEAGNAIIDIPAHSAAVVLRLALILWVSTATKRDQNLHQIAMLTDVDARKPHVQSILDQLSNQLSLPIEDISALAAKHGEKEKKSESKRTE